MTKQKIQNLLSITGRPKTGFRKNVIVPDTFWGDELEYIYCVWNDIDSQPLCHCGGELSFFGGFKTGKYANHCSRSCATSSFDGPNFTERVQIKYGVENTSQIEWVKDKKEETILSRYGVKNAFQINKDWKNNIRSVCELKGLWTPLSEVKDFEKYRRIVQQITKIQKVECLKNSHEKRGLNGVDGAYQLDHKYSVKNGFLNGILPYYIGNINNLQFIKWEDNISKGISNSISENELFMTHLSYK